MAVVLSELMTRWNDGHATSWDDALAHIVNNRNVDSVLVRIVDSVIPSHELIHLEASRSYVDLPLSRKWDIVEEIHAGSPGTTLSLVIGGHEVSCEGATVPLAALQYSDVSIRISLPTTWRREDDSACIVLHYKARLVQPECRITLMRASILRCPSFTCSQGCILFPHQQELLRASHVVSSQRAMSATTCSASL
jgi:hypothetical protein